MYLYLGYLRISMIAVSFCNYIFYIWLSILHMLVLSLWTPKYKSFRWCFKTKQVYEEVRLAYRKTLAVLCFQLSSIPAIHKYFTCESVTCLKVMCINTHPNWTDTNLLKMQIQKCDFFFFVCFKLRFYSPPNRQMATKTWPPLQS